MYKIVEFSHLLIKDYFETYKHDQMVFIDATCGRGFDTIYMAELIKGYGHVYSYDIQNEAIDYTSEIIKNKNITNTTLRLMSHENILEKNFDLVIFNLGYLPNGNKEITTNHNTSLSAIKHLIEQFDTIDHNILIIIVLYPGHHEGKLESDLIDNYAKNLVGRKYLVSKYMNYNRETSPFIITISKNKTSHYN